MMPSGTSLPLTASHWSWSLVMIVPLYRRDTRRASSPIMPVYYFCFTSRHHSCLHKQTLYLQRPCSRFEDIDGALRPKSKVQQPDLAYNQRFAIRHCTRIFSKGKSVFDSVTEHGQVYGRQPTTARP